MKQNLINDVVRDMLPYLNNTQIERLQAVMQHALFSYEVIENENKDSSGKKNDGSKQETTESGQQTYILNTNTKKFHKPDCYSVKQMSEKNKKKYKGSRKSLINEGFSPCKNCNP